MKFEDIKKLPPELQGAIFTLNQVTEEQGRELVRAHERIDRFTDQVQTLTAMVQFFLKRMSEPDDAAGSPPPKVAV